MVSIIKLNSICMIQSAVFIQQNYCHPKCVSIACKQLKPLTFVNGFLDQFYLVVEILLRTRLRVSGVSPM